MSANEETLPNYGYPSEYKIKSFDEQVNILRGFFPELKSFPKNITNDSLHICAEGWFAIPRWERIGREYGEAVEKIVDLLAKTAKEGCRRYRGQSPYGHWERGAIQEENKSGAFQKLGDRYKGCDILAVAAQFGSRHRKIAPYQVMRNILCPDEFALGIYEVGIMLLTHPERLTKSVNLGIYCPGDTLPNPSNGWAYPECPYFVQGELGMLSEKTDWLDFGSATGFLPGPSIKDLF